MKRSPAKKSVPQKRRTTRRQTVTDSVSFNPMSIDSQFMKLNTRMDSQDTVLTDIRDYLVKTSGRVGKLEVERARLVGYCAGAGAIISIAVTYFIHHF